MEDICFMVMLLIKSARACHAMSRREYEQLFETLSCVLCRLHQQKYCVHKAPLSALQAEVAYLKCCIIVQQTYNTQTVHLTKIERNDHIPQRSLWHS